MTIETFEKYKVMTADEGLYITDWDGEDIMLFSYASKMFLGLNMPVEQYYEITAERKDELEAIRLEETEKQREQEDEPR